MIDLQQGPSTAAPRHCRTNDERFSRRGVIEILIEVFLVDRDHDSS
jgi:hypothetical protein